MYERVHIVRMDLTNVCLRQCLGEYVCVYTREISKAYFAEVTAVAAPVECINKALDRNNTASFELRQKVQSLPSKSPYKII